MANAFLDAVASLGVSRASDICLTELGPGGVRDWTWSDVLGRAEQYAGRLRDCAAPGRQVVFIILKSQPELQCAFVGAMMAGLAPSFLPYPNPKQDAHRYWSQHVEVFRRTAPAAIVCFEELLPDLQAALEGSGIPLLTPGGVGGTQRFTGDFPDENAIALLQHSSGTTGLKKGVALGYRAIERQIASYAESLSIRQGGDSVIGTWLPLYHDMGLFTGFLMPLRLGLRVVAIDPFVWVAQPSLLLEAVERHAVTHMWLPNFAFMHLVRGLSPRRSFDLSSLESVVSCSEPCKPEAFDRFLARFSTNGVKPEALRTCYAMAETVFAISQSRGPAPKRLAVTADSLREAGTVRLAPAEAAGATNLLSNGPPIEGAEVAILRNGVFVGELQSGEICVRGDFLFSGYFADREKTAAAFFNDWFRTGDLGFLHEGEIYVTGRIKDLIIVNGKNLFAHDVEAALTGIEGLKPGRAVALGLYNEATGSEALVVVAERSEAERPRTELMADINRAVLDDVGVACGIVEIVEPGWLIKTTSGKIHRADNLDKFVAMRKAAVSAR